MSTLMELVASSVGLKSAEMLDHWERSGVAFEDIMPRAQQLGKMTRGDHDDARAMRLLTMFAAWSVDGQIAVYEWGRDCDLCEASSLHWIPATLEAFDQFEDSMYQNAEGPCHCYPVSPADAAEFAPYFRDLAAEMAGY